MTTTARSTLHQWQRNWEKRSGKERNLIVAGIALGLVAVYGVTLFPLAGKRIEKLEYDMEKLQVRNRNAAKAEAKPFVAPPGLSGKNPAEAERELRALRQQMDESANELRTLRAQFVALDDSLAMNALKSGLTSLAEAGDMEVTAIQHVVLRREDKDKAPTPEMLKEAAEANPYKRPLLEMQARASFRGLMQFLDGLHQLPYVAAPVASSIVVAVERNPQTNAPIRQWLEVRIRFAI